MRCYQILISTPLKTSSWNLNMEFCKIIYPFQLGDFQLPRSFSGVEEDKRCFTKLFEYNM